MKPQKKKVLKRFVCLTLQYGNILISVDKILVSLFDLLH